MGSRSQGEVDSLHRLNYPMANPQSILLGNHDYSQGGGGEMSRIRLPCLLLISTIIIAFLLNSCQDARLFQLRHAEGAELTTVYCIGDSLTASDYYAAELRTLLGADYTVVNKGINGNTTTQMLNRFSTDVLNHAPDFVVIWGGVNDLAGNTQQTTMQSNLQSMYTQAHDVGITVIAIAMSPWKGSLEWDPIRQAATSNLRTWISTAAINVDYAVDIYPLLGKPWDLEALDSVYDSGDHLHFNTSAGVAIGREIYDVVFAVHLPLIAQPSNLRPADSVTGVSLTPTLQSTTFSASDGGSTHQASQWQVRSAAGDYASPVYDSGPRDASLTAITVPSGFLRHSTAYGWHVRHQSNDSTWSDWSAETFFETGGEGGIPSWIWVVAILVLVVLLVAIVCVVTRRRAGRVSRPRYRIVP